MTRFTSAVIDGFYANANWKDVLPDRELLELALREGEKKYDDEQRFIARLRSYPHLRKQLKPLLTHLQAFLQLWDDDTRELIAGILEDETDPGEVIQEFVAAIEAAIAVASDDGTLPYREGALRGNVSDPLRLFLLHVWAAWEEKNGPGRFKTSVKTVDVWNKERTRSTPQQKMSSRAGEFALTVARVIDPDITPATVDREIRKLTRTHRRKGESK